MSTNTPIINDIPQSVVITRVRSKRPKVSSSDLHAAILSRYATGMRVAQVARELNVTRATVYSHIKREHSLSGVTMGEIQAMVPEAMQTVRKAINNGDARIAMQFLERVQALDTNRHSKTSDNSLTVAINTLITPATTSQSITTTHPSGQKGEGDDLNLSVHGQNLPLLGPPEEK